MSKSKRNKSREKKCEQIEDHTSFTKTAVVRYIKVTLCLSIIGVLFSLRRLLDDRTFSNDPSYIDACYYLGFSLLTAFWVLRGKINFSKTVVKILFVVLLGSSLIIYWNIFSFTQYKATSPQKVETISAQNLDKLKECKLIELDTLELNFDYNAENIVEHHTRHPQFEYYQVYQIKNLTNVYLGIIWYNQSPRKIITQELHDIIVRPVKNQIEYKHFYQTITQRKTIKLQDQNSEPIEIELSSLDDELNYEHKPPTVFQWISKNQVTEGANGLYWIISSFFFSILLIFIICHFWEKDM